MKTKSSTALSPDFSGKRPFRPIVAAITIFVVALLCSVTLIRRLEQRRFELERARVSDIAGDHAHALQAGIERSLTATYSLAALVREGKGGISSFEATAREMLPFFPGAASLQLAPGGVVRQIVPLAGNEGAIGHDLFKDPARRNEAIKTRDDGKLTLAGPFTLKQGGFGAVGRMPVYLDNDTGGRSFWGFTNVLILFPQVLEPARLANLEQRGFRYELWRLHPDTGKRQIISASSSSPLIKPVDHSFELPNGTWTLSVAPTAGWGDPGGLALKSALGVAFSLLLFFLTRSLLGTRAKALQIAQDLTLELRESEEKFRAIFDHTFQFVGLMSVDGTLIEANRSALELSGIRETEVIGKLFWETPWWAHSREMQEKLRAAIEKCAQGEFVRFEATHPAIDGRLHYVDFSLKPVMDKDGNVVLLIPEGRDITDRKRAEEAIHLQTVELEQEVAERQMAQENLQEKALLLEEEIGKRQEAQAELERLNAELELRVRERTVELEEKNAELHKMNRIFVGRELRMVELKERIRELEQHFLPHDKNTKAADGQREKL